MLLSGDNSFASLAAAFAKRSASSLPVMFACPGVQAMIVLTPLDLRSSISSLMSLVTSMHYVMLDFPV